MKIIQSNFGTIKVIDPVVPDSRTTAQGIYGKYAAQIATGGRVKYQGAGLVDHGPAGVRQGYAAVKESERLPDKIKQKNITAWENKTGGKWIDQNSSQKSKIAAGTITGEGGGSKTKTVVPTEGEKKLIKNWEKNTGKKYKNQNPSNQWKIRTGTVLGVDKSASFDASINAIRNAFVADPDATLEELAKEVYGSDFKKANKSGKLRMMTDISNDVPKFMEALMGVRSVKGFRIPNEEIMLDIISNIENNKKGFRFADNTLRLYKFRIRDMALGFDSNMTINERHKLNTLKKGMGLSVDETGTLSGTFDKAPGYTSGSQLIDHNLNILKGHTIDKRFNHVLKAMMSDDPDKLYQWKVNDKKTINVNRNKLIELYNNESKKFKKKHKIDSPVIKVGVSPEKAVSNYGLFSKAEQANMQDVFKKRNFSIGLSKETKPLKVILDNWWCGRKVAAEGGRIGFKAGSGCPVEVRQRNFLALTDDVAKGRVTGEAAEQIAKQAGKVVAKVGSKSALASILGPAGIGLDIAYEVGSIGTDVLGGKSFKRALQDNWITGAFISGTGQEEFHKELFAKDSRAKPYGTPLDLIDKIEKAEKNLESVKQATYRTPGQKEEAIAMVEKRIKNLYSEFDKAARRKDEGPAGQHTRYLALEPGSAEQRAYEQAKQEFESIEAAKAPLKWKSKHGFEQMVKEGAQKRPVNTYGYVKPKQYGEFSKDQLDEFLKWAGAYGPHVNPENFGFSSYEDFSDRLSRQKSTWDIAQAGGVSKMAGGGLANLTRTVAPDSGPMSQGLSYLYNRVKKQ